MAGRSDYLVVARVPDEHDGISAGGIPRDLGVHLLDEWARGVDRRQAASRCSPVHARLDAVRRQDDGARFGPVVLRVDEDHAASLELPDDLQVVDDVLADVDRRAVDRERTLDGPDRSVDPGAKASRGSEEYAC